MSSVPTAASIAFDERGGDSTWLGETLLTVRGVTLRLGEIAVLDGVSFTIRDRIRRGTTTGQIVSVLGPSGVGKTRLLRIIAQLDVAERGSVSGKDGAPLTSGEVGMVFQSYPLLRHRTVAGNLHVAGQLGGLAGDALRQRSASLLERFALSEHADHYPSQLSGGQRQRVAIAQQLVVPKHLLLMDEPFSGLDPASIEEVSRLIVSVANLDEQNTILLVTHDIRAALSISDTILMLGRAPAQRGAHVLATYDLVERGIAWRHDATTLPAFAALEDELRHSFHCTPGTRITP